MAVKTVMGPAGAPMRPPYGSFAGKPPFTPSRGGHFTVMGPAGAPMRPPYGSFAGKMPFTRKNFDYVIRARRRGRR